LAALSINELGGRVPRPYTLGKRGDSKAETRARIVAATLDLYREVGVAGASVPAIARAADVAPATVRNHFPGPDDLAEAAANAVLAALDMPDASIFEGVSGPVERVRRLAAELAAFFERATEWWEIRQQDRDLANAWSGPEARYEERLAELVRVALTPLGDDPAVRTVVGMALGSLYFALRGSGLSSAATLETELGLVIPWLERHLG
jgi:AcrR family transcriptional regulator